MALTSVGLAAVHMVSLLDSYAQLRLVDLVVPFLGNYRTLWLAGLGPLAVDVILVITVVSLLRHQFGPRVFRMFHYAAAYAMWPTRAGPLRSTGSKAGTLAVCAVVAMRRSRARWADLCVIAPRLVGRSVALLLG